MKTIQVGSELFKMDRQRERQTERRYSRSSRHCQSA